MKLSPNTSSEQAMSQHPPLLRLDVDPGVPVTACGSSLCWPDGTKVELWLRVGTGDAKRYQVVVTE